MEVLSSIFYFIFLSSTMDRELCYAYYECLSKEKKAGKKNILFIKCWFAYFSERSKHLMHKTNRNVRG